MKNARFYSAYERELIQKMEKTGFRSHDPKDSDEMDAEHVRAMIFNSDVLDRIGPKTLEKLFEAKIYRDPIIQVFMKTCAQISFNVQILAGRGYFDGEIPLEEEGSE